MEGEPKSINGVFGRTGLAEMKCVDLLERRAPHVGRAVIQESFEDLSEKPAGGLHADVRVEADDRKGRERLCKCGARPAFAEAQFCEAKDGRIAPFGYCFAAPCGTL